MKTISVAAMAAAILLASTAAFAANADDAKVDKILARFANEPAIREVQVAAIEYYHVSPDTIATLRARTHQMAWVPGVGIGFTNSLSSYKRNVDDILFRARGIAIFEDMNADFIGVNVSASWGLDRLVFNAAELDVLSLIGIQDGIQREVTTIYYVRRRLQVETLLNPPQGIDARISNQLRLEELTGLLDAYTGGFFSRTSKARAGRTAEATAGGAKP
jgi:hypothetical protein